jgi:gamma-hexachlorocyclohexane dehydrochlorinase
VKRDRHTDAIWDLGPFGSFMGHEGIHKAAHGVLYPIWRETHHLTSNLRITFSDADHANGVSNVDCMGATKDGVVRMISATYTDAFERRNREWKIARRTVTMHYFNPIPGAEMTPPS